MKGRPRNPPLFYVIGREQKKEFAPYGANPHEFWCRRSELNRHDPEGRGILSPLRLPVSPLRHVSRIYAGNFHCQEKCIDTFESAMLNDTRISAIFQMRGAVAQLGERLNGIQEVTSSILVSSTNSFSFNFHELSCRRNTSSNARYLITNPFSHTQIGFEYSARFL
jgi:hypothetical protein